MKKVALVLVLLLIVPTLLTACGAESTDASRDYMKALLEGKVEEAQKYACEGFEAGTADLIASIPRFVEGSTAVRNIDLKYDVGKGNDQEKITVTGSYEIVELNASGNVIADSEQLYELASSVRDKRDIDDDGNDSELVDTRIKLQMEKDGDDWCVLSLEGGFWNPVFAEESGEAEEVEEADEADEVEDADTAEDAEEGEEASD